MSNYFILNLDTTGPNIKINAPNYTAVGLKEEIIIKSNEYLDNYQDIYIIDNQGIKRKLILDYHGSYFKGVVDFLNYPVGISKIYAQLRDVVLNESNIAIHNIDVKEEPELFIEQKIQTMNIKLDSKTFPIYSISSNRKIFNNKYFRSLIINNSIRGVENFDKTRNIEVKVK